MADNLNTLPRFFLYEEKKKTGGGRFNIELFHDKVLGKKEMNDNLDYVMCM